MYDLNTEEGLAGAKQWTEAHLSRIRSGGAWIVPRSGSIYTINHETKTARRTGLLPDPPIDYVLRQMGWTVYADDQS